MNAELIFRDELTGAFNRRYLNEKLDREIEPILERRAPFSVVMIDIDSFKEINDLHGHLVGDQVLRDFTRFLQSSVRPYDRVIRYGGDEFVCIMPDLSRADAGRLYQRMLEKCRYRRMAGQLITMSVGIASFPEDGAALPDLLKAADDSLYQAKRGGRDRIGGTRTRTIEVPIKIFIDRHREREQLSLLLVGIEGRARAAVVGGRTGMGKTRLVREVLGKVSHREVMWADCMPMDEAISYFPVREFIKYKVKRRGRQLVGEMPPADQVELAKLVPDLAADIGPAPSDIQPVLDKYRLYEGVRMFLEDRPMKRVLAVDNVQWIDPESIGVFKYLIRTTRDSDLLFVFIRRTEEPNEAVDDFLSEAGREIELTEVALGPFGEPDIRQAVNAILGGGGPERLVRHLSAESGGNPYFLEELAKDLYHPGNLAPGEDGWRFRMTAGDEVPKTIEDVAQRKLHGLSPEARQVLVIASVAGWFDPDIIRDITGFNPGHIIGLLSEVERQGFITESGKRLSFSEGACRTAVYRNHAAGFKGRELHRRIGAIIESRSQRDRQEWIEQLAVHFYRGGEREKGIEYCIQAGDRSRERYANQEAVRFYRWALELIDAGRDGRRAQAVDCLLRIGEIGNLEGTYAAATADFSRAEKLGTTAVERAKARLGLASVHQNQGRLGQALECLGPPLRGNAPEELAVRTDIHLLKCWIHRLQSQYRKSILEGGAAVKLIARIHAGDPARADRLRTRACSYQGATYWMQGRLPQAVQLYTQGLKLSESIGERMGIAMANCNLGNVYKDKGELAKALGHYRNCLAISEDIGHRQGMGLTLSNIGIVHYSQGSLEKAAEYFQKALRIDEELGFLQGIGMACNNLGNVHLDWGQYEKAGECYHRSLGIAREMGYRRGVGIASNNLGIIEAAHGRHRQAIVQYRRCLDIADEVGDRLGAALALHQLGESSYELGDLRQAQAHLARSERILTQLHHREHLIAVHLTLSELKLRQARQRPGRAAVRERLVKDALRYATGALHNSNQLGLQLPGGQSQLMLGKLAAFIGQGTTAWSHFKAALKILQPLRHPKQLADALLETGIFLRDADRDLRTGFKGAEPAEGYLASAAAIYRELGLTHRTREAGELLHRTQPSG